MGVKLKTRRAKSKKAGTTEASAVAQPTTETFARGPTEAKSVDAMIAELPDVSECGVGGALDEALLSIWESVRSVAGKAGIGLRELWDRAQDLLMSGGHDDDAYFNKHVFKEAVVRLFRVDGNMLVAANRWPGMTFTRAGTKPRDAVFVRLAAAAVAEYRALELDLLNALGLGLRRLMFAHLTDDDLLDVAPSLASRFDVAFHLVLSGVQPCLRMTPLSRNQTAQTVLTHLGYTCMAPVLQKYGLDADYGFSLKMVVKRLGATSDDFIQYWVLVDERAQKIDKVPLAMLQSRYFLFQQDVEPTSRQAAAAMAYPITGQKSDVLVLIRDGARGEEVGPWVNHHICSHYLYGDICYLARVDTREGRRAILNHFELCRDACLDINVELQMACIRITELDTASEPSLGDFLGPLKEDVEPETLRGSAGLVAAKPFAGWQQVGLEACTGGYCGYCGRGDLDRTERGTPEAADFPERDTHTPDVTDFTDTSSV